MKHRYRILMAVVLTLALLTPLTTQAEGPGDQGHGAPESPTASDVQALLTRLPLSFIANAGQTDPAVRFHVAGAGHTIFFTPNEVIFRAAPSPAARGVSIAPAVRLRFVGANPNPTVEGLEPLPGIASFFLGSDPAKWRTNVPTYGAVAYRALYPGIDLVYSGRAGLLKSQFLVAPGADPGAIRLAYRGVEALKVRQDGALVLKTALGELVEGAPQVYQEIHGRRVAVEGCYRLLGEGQVGFALGAYDPAHPLVIDPPLSYSAYLGGDGSDWGYGIAVDSAGNAYVTGRTKSTPFPAGGTANSDGFWGDVFVVKVNATGTALLYTVLLGGSEMDEAQAIAVDSAGNAYVTGYTSGAFPVVNAFQPFRDPDPFNYYEAFLSKLNATGSALLYSTYFGGNRSDMGYGIAVDSAGHAYVTGRTYSSNLPVRNAFDATYNGFSPGSSSDAFVAKFDPSQAGDPSLIYSTYLGGDYDNANDYGYGIAVDSAGRACVTGTTYSSNFPTANPAQSAAGGAGDAFVTLLASAGNALVYSTYLGGSGYDSGRAIALDASGNAYVTGYTESSSDFPTTTDALQTTFGGGTEDAFVTRLSSDGSTFAYSTYLGGSGDDQGHGIGLDAPRNIYVAGWTDSSDFPSVDPVQPAPGGALDAFVTKLSAAGDTLVYSTYLGGSGDEEGYDIAVRGSGDAFVTGYTKSSSDFPTTTGAFQTAFGGGVRDAFVSKIPGAIIVNETGDDPDADTSDGTCDRDASTPGNQCTLRAAIETANANPGQETINFDIPGGGVPTISPQTPLPTVQDPVVIDATTQPGEGRVRLDGNSAGAGANGLRITAGSSTVRGLIITRFARHGILLESNGDNLIEGNYIGTDPSDTPGLGNGGAGVMVESGTGHRISQNSMANNGGLGIDLAPAGATPNDTTSDPDHPEAGDQDGGANRLQNWPMVAGVTISDTLLVVNFMVDTHPDNATYPLQVEFYVADGTADGAEGKTYLGSVTYTQAEAQQFVVKTFSPTQMPALDTPVVATATDEAGNTSEFSYRPVRVSEAQPGLVFKVENDGDVYADGTYQTPAADFAERWPVAFEQRGGGAEERGSNPPCPLASLHLGTGLEPGDVLALGPDGGVMRAGLPGAGPVVGVYATRPGFLGSGPDAPRLTPHASVPVALAGIVPVKVSAEHGPVRPGDLLTLSSTPGVAARAAPISFGGRLFYLPGSFFGKALEPFEGPGTGVIRVLLVGQ